VDSCRQVKRLLSRHWAVPFWRPAGRGAIVHWALRTEPADASFVLKALTLRFAGLCGSSNRASARTKGHQMKPILGKIAAMLAAGGALIAAVPASAQWRGDDRSTARDGRSSQQNYRTSRANSNRGANNGYNRNNGYTGNQSGYAGNRGYGNRTGYRRDYDDRGRSGNRGGYYNYPSYYGYGGYFYPYDYGYYDYGYPSDYSYAPYAYDPYADDPYGYDDYPY
jgi:hypothetical protein